MNRSGSRTGPAGPRAPAECHRGPRCDGRLERDIDVADAKRNVQEDVGARQVDAVRDGDTLVVAVDMISECVVGVRAEGEPPREFKGYLRAGPAYRSVGCATRLYTEASPGG
ncbi:hypothetical protein GCM10023198_13950 [Promicromonospora umidemergens]|uniref:Acetyltransferase (GNAT) family protein n=1 Tax=Promicromonospora umidemergens TaxID=629679 RepID=A0ABP8WU08_9MICO